jgi:penicillin-binding protein 2
LASSAPRPGRFLPGDPRVEEPYRLTPQIAFRVAVLAALTLAIFAVLFLRLWALQVLSGDKYLAAANDNRVRTLHLEAPRGPILDTNGHVLVRNVAGTRVELWPADLPKTWKAELRELHALSWVTGVPVRTMVADLKAHGGDPLTPVVVQRGIKRSQYFYLSEHQAQFPGVQLEDSYLRSYPYQSLAAQILGYVGAISPQQYKAHRNSYQPTDTIGQAGIEATYDQYLRGKDGTADLTVDAQGRPKGAAVTTVSPTPGDSLRLTLDVNLQRAAEQAVRYGIQVARSANQYGADGGALVAMNPYSGAILAMASYPTYEPSIFSTQRAKLTQFFLPSFAQRHNYPSLNRAIDGTYPPGSTFKPVTALAAMEEHILSPTEIIPCTPDYLAYKQIFHNWTPLIDTGMSLTQAIAQSCDTYFYRVGDRFYRLPPSYGHPLQAWANRFGLGQYTGIDIGPEAKGSIPTPESWCIENGGPPCRGYLNRIWKPGYSIQMAIGQGQVLVTPLQMARFYAMIANGGKLVTPHLAKDVEVDAGDGKVVRVLREFGAQPPQPTNVDPTALRYVQDGLEEATHSPLGTGYGVFGSFPVNIAGKTGSAEKVDTIPGDSYPTKRTQSWWCGYGPFNAPQVVVCAMIENGGEGGAAAAPAALKFFEAYFHHDNASVTAHASD